MPHGGPLEEHRRLAQPLAEGARGIDGPVVRRVGALTQRVLQRGDRRTQQPPGVVYQGTVRASKTVRLPAIEAQQTLAIRPAADGRRTSEELGGAGRVAQHIDLLGAREVWDRIGALQRHHLRARERRRDEAVGFAREIHRAGEVAVENPSSSLAFPGTPFCQYCWLSKCDCDWPA